ncbi:unnamed protein product [Rotaria sordida]|uniref:GH18 domain-containing protein n=3 Tax=Rotaria sordida TaxID=392033 RepID=A0A814JSY3_9BILA|nr:unnamed protein product [Rotaria sordida]
MLQNFSHILVLFFLLNISINGHDHYIQSSSSFFSQNNIDKRHVIKNSTIPYEKTGRNIKRPLSTDSLINRQTLERNYIKKQKTNYHTSNNFIRNQQESIESKSIVKRKINPLYSDLILYSNNQTNLNSSIQMMKTFQFSSINRIMINISKLNIDIETKNISIVFHDIVTDFLHLKHSQSISIQYSTSMSNNEMISIKKYFIEKILIILDEYINNKINKDLIDKKSNQINLIYENLTDIFNIYESNFDSIYFTRIHTKENLTLIINSIMSTTEYVDDKYCSIKFKYFNYIYCIKIDFNKILWNLPKEDNSIQSLKLFNSINIQTQILSYEENHHPQVFQYKTNSKTTEPLIVCYYTNWSQYRHGPGRFYPENLDVNLCTHIVYAFAKLDNDRIVPYEWNDESTPWSVGMYQRIINLRKSNKLKVLLGLGGWNHGSHPFSNMVHNETQRTNFIRATIRFLEKHQFDGLDLDWEYPGSREGSRPSDKQHFSNLLIELKEAFRPFHFLLTAAVGAGKPTIDAAYEISQVCQILDIVNLMSYDLHGSWETKTGIHIPLYSRQNDNQLDKQLTQDWSVRYWINNGCSPSKIVMGLALYGRTFRLASPSKNYIGAPAVGPGNAGLYTNEQGFLAYYEICTRVKQQGWTKIFDEEQKTNYAYKDEQWVGYDDLYSIGYKIQYVQEMGLAGIMFWAADLDDFTGSVCNEGKYPLMNKAVSLIRSQIQPTISSIKINSTKSSFQEKKRIVCYYTNWTQYRPDQGKFYPEDLDGSLCTHIIYASAILKNSKLAPFQLNDEDTQSNKGMYSRVLALKKTHNIKILLGVSGPNFGSADFSHMVENEQLRKVFVYQATLFIRDHQFDGLNLDWEYPVNRLGSRSQDKQLFTSLVKELKEAFEPYNLLLTATVAAEKSTIETAYEIDKIAKYVDFINLMTYNFHESGSKNMTGHHTALYAHPQEDQYQMTLNQNWSVNYWIKQGMPKEKISMGLATYGRTFKLFNNSNRGIRLLSSGPGERGKYTREYGFIAYYEICEKLNSGQWTSEYDDIQKSMYAYDEDTWVSYDNIQTISIRANYVIEQNLGGVMIWAADLDDFSGKFCNNGRYPLMNAVANIIRTGQIQPIYISTRPTSTSRTYSTIKMTKFTLPLQSNALSSWTSWLTRSSPINILSQSIVCMTRINPVLFNSVNINLCSHLIIIERDLLSIDIDLFQSTLSLDILKQLKVMKRKNENLKIFYSILGQWNSKHFDLLRNDQQRQKLNKKIEQYLTNYTFDGLDIDWNIQVDQIPSLTDKHLLSTWLLELRYLFVANKYSLSIGISGEKHIIDSYYDFNIISKMVDFIRLMAFDWTRINETSLTNRVNSLENQRYNYQFNYINWLINYIKILGVSSKQISLSIQTYGRLFEFIYQNQYLIRSSRIDSSKILPYSHICKLLKTKDFIQEYDNKTSSSYLFNFKTKQLISFDTIDDIQIKVNISF